MMGEFYIGVVEDRVDPKLLGRVRVRVFGLHSPDRKAEVPIESLPWSFVMQPANASTSGPQLSQLVEGTWVVVMYMDQNHQDPLVIGSIPGIYNERPNYSEGFSDPFGVYPRWVEEDSELSLIHDEKRWLEHPTYKARLENRITEIQRAKKYQIPTVSPTPPDEDFDRTVWDEPDLRGEQDSSYPYNAVREFEGGQIEEHDSTSDNTRITHMHQTGTYEEILHDGSKTVKIVGDGYSITLRDQNMFIQGDLNVTVEGDMRHMVQGDYTLEVGGAMHTFIGGNREEKIEGSDMKEIGVDESINVSEKRGIRVGKDQVLMVDENETKIVGERSETTIKGAHIAMHHSNSDTITVGNETSTTFANRLVTTKKIHRIESIEDIEIDTDSAVKVIAPDDVLVKGDVVAEGVSLVDHVHEGVEPGPGSTDEPVADGETIGPFPPLDDMLEGSS